MTHTPHEFVENYQDHEAVLLCTNQDLPPYSTDAVVRAFQTFQFQDGTTDTKSDDDIGIRFVHLDSGAVIQYDGSIVAINYGDHWVHMLPDLVLTLNALGWRTAEAYHPAETMKQFMQDLGRSIPANADFDVLPAQTGKRISEYPAGQSLLSKAQSLTGAESVIFNEFQQLTSAVPTIDPNQIRATSPVRLVDDDGSGIGGNEDIFFDEILGRVSASNHPVTAPSEEPPVVALDSEDWPHGTSAKTFAAKDSREHDGKEVISVVARPNQAVRAAPQPSKTSAPGADHRGNIVMLGETLMLFDTPNYRISTGSLASVSAEYTIIHVRPGIQDSPTRWDVMGEILDSQPWFAERMVSLMRLRGNCNTALVAALMLAVKQRQENAQIRDLVDLALEEVAVQAQALAGVSKTAETMLKQAARTGTLTQSVDALLHRIGGIALAPSPRSFLDVRNLLGDRMGQSFTLRSLASSQEKCAYVIHLDVQDSHGIGWICTFMRDMAKCISGSGSASS